jgi:hypothetical protein
LTGLRCTTEGNVKVRVVGDRTLKRNA